MNPGPRCLARVPPGRWTPSSDSRPGSSRSRRGPYRNRPLSETEKDTKVTRFHHFLTTCCRNVTFLLTQNECFSAHRKPETHFAGEACRARRDENPSREGTRARMGGSRPADDISCRGRRRAFPRDVHSDVHGKFTSIVSTRYCTIHEWCLRAPANKCNKHGYISDKISLNRNFHAVVL